MLSRYSSQVPLAIYLAMQILYDITLKFGERDSISKLYWTPARQKKVQAQFDVLEF